MFINHCHVFPKGLLEFITEINQEERKLAEDFGTIAHLKEYMQELGAEKAVVFFVHEPYIYAHFDPNKWLLKELQGEKDLFGFASLKPTDKSATEKLARYVSKGFVGVKLHPPVQHFQINDPAAEDFYSLAEELKVPLLFHTGAHGWELEKYRPILLDEVAQNHPELPIIIEHTGGTAFFYEALAVLQNNQNCFAGIATTLVEKHPWYLGRERICLLLKAIGADRIIYGTDFPAYDSKQAKSDIEAIDNLDITSGDKEKILGGNIAALIKSSKSPRAIEVP